MGTPISINGCDCTEYKTSGSGTVSRTDSSRKRVFLCGWGDLEAVLTGIMGDDEMGMGNTGMPYEEGSLLLASNVKWDPIGTPSQDANGMPVYPKAKIDVTFKPADLEIEDSSKEAEDDGEGIWMEESANFQTQYLQLPRYSVRWEGVAGHEGILKEPAGIPIVTGDVTLTRHQMDDINRESLVAAAGKVNELTFFGWPAGTLLFSGFSPRRTIDTLGKSSKYTLTVIFKCRLVRDKDGNAVGWNYQFRPGYGWWKVLINNEAPLFPSYNFRDL